MCTYVYIRTLIINCLVIKHICTLIINYLIIHKHTLVIHKHTHRHPIHNIHVGVQGMIHSNMHTDKWIHTNKNTHPLLLPLLSFALSLLLSLSLFLALSFSLGLAHALYIWFSLPIPLSLSRLLVRIQHT